MKETGNISINTENILPIIKKWLYSNKDIFIRELIANGCDAIAKHKKLVELGEAEAAKQDYFIRVVVDEAAKTVSFEDNGIGMSAEEVRNYINQVAFSGAQEFIEKYEQAKDSIIGHFGLGFYSAFMVSKTVLLETRTYRDGEEAVKWECDGGIEYSIEAGEKPSQGTIVTLKLNDEDQEFSHEHTLRDAIEKYCAFLPVPIFLESAGKKIEKEKEKQEPSPLNDVSPLWLKTPKDCTDEEYKTFYHKVFKTFDEPLFWIHLNVDYPFNLKGILFFPKLKNQFEDFEGQIKIYNNQVFVADNIKEVIPEFLMLLKGVIDCPDLPLNVSRSFLQNDGTVRKLQTHITKKVADKLTALFENERDAYERDWPDISPFVRYGCLKDEKFYEQIKDALLYERIGGGMWKSSELLDYAKEHDNKVYFASDSKAQAFYIAQFIKNGQDAIKMEGPVDSYFVLFLEQKNSGVKLARIDSEISESMKSGDPAKESKVFEELFRKATGDEELSVELTALRDESLPAMLVIDDEQRRYAQMMRGYGMPELPPTYKLVLNTSSPLIGKLEAMNDEKAGMLAEQILDIARFSAGVLGSEQAKLFIERSNRMLDLLAELGE